MRRTKIYLDSSVISHLHQLDAPNKMNDTLELWEEIKQGKYDVYISDIGLREIGNCRGEKFDILADYLNSIKYSLITTTLEIEELADKIIQFGVLSRNQLDDCLHIAAAVVSDCNIIVSWNFSHIVKAKTINGVRTVNLMNGYNTIDIYSPPMIIERNGY